MTPVTSLSSSEILSCANTREEKIATTVVGQGRATLAVPRHPAHRRPLPLRSSAAPCARPRRVELLHRHPLARELACACTSLEYLMPPPRRHAQALILRRPPPPRFTSSSSVPAARCPPARGAPAQQHPHPRKPGAAIHRSSSTSCMNSSPLTPPGSATSRSADVPRCRRSGVADLHQRPAVPTCCQANRDQ